MKRNNFNYLDYRSTLKKKRKRNSDSKAKTYSSGIIGNVEVIIKKNRKGLREKENKKMFT